MRDSLRFQSNLTANPQETKAQMSENQTHFLRPKKAPDTMVATECMKWKDKSFASCHHYRFNLTESYYRWGRIRQNKNQTRFICRHDGSVCIQFLANIFKGSL